MQTPTKETSKDGTIRYWLNNKLHREDGPAVIYADGTQYWWINSQLYSFKDYCRELKLTDEDVLFLKLKYSSCIST